MWIIAYYQDMRVCYFAGVSKLGLAIKTRNENELRKFYTRDEALLWQNQNPHLQNGNPSVIIKEERAKDLIRFFIR